MNKKQKIIAITAAALIILDVIFPLGAIDKGTLPRVFFILLAAIFLIYIVKDKNPPKEKPNEESKKVVWRKRR